MWAVVQSDAGWVLRSYLMFGSSISLCFKIVGWQIPLARWRMSVKENVSSAWCAARCESPWNNRCLLKVTGWMWPLVCLAYLILCTSLWTLPYVISLNGHSDCQATDNCLLSSSSTSETPTGEQGHQWGGDRWEIKSWIKGFGLIPPACLPQWVWTHLSSFWMTVFQYFPDSRIFFFSCLILWLFPTLLLLDYGRNKSTSNLLKSPNKPVALIKSDLVSGAEVEN